MVELIHGKDEIRVRFPGVAPFKNRGFMNDPIIKKPRSLQSRDDGGWNGNNTYKHFRVNGANPDEKASNGKSRKKHNKLICKRSPNKEHRYDEITVGYITHYREQMRVSCSYCGKYNYSFYVNIGPLPEWLIKWQEKYNLNR